jgi:hypothetical protein
MKITIDYESSWRNSFLDGSNDEPISKDGRKFIASMKCLKDEKNYIERIVTKNTVMGVLNRLIGDQRKLYQARSCFGSSSYYFSDLEDNIRFEDIPEVINNEIVYLRNMNGSTDKSTFSGMIKVNDPAFTSEYSKELWGILYMGLDDLCEFIVNGKNVDVNIQPDPIGIIEQVDAKTKEKPVVYDGIVKKAVDILSLKFGESFKCFSKKSEVYVLSMYCSALYYQLSLLESKYDVTSVKTKAGNISGFSNNGFTKKDFMSVYTTGGKKPVYGNPYIREEYIKKEGKVSKGLVKANGKLFIELDIGIDKSIELKNMIDNAGVSSFYLGKKGLAYVSSIRV